MPYGPRRDAVGRAGVALVAIIVVAFAAIGLATAGSQSASPRPGSLQTHASSQVVTSQSSTLLGTSISVSIDVSGCHGNCSVNLQPWPTVYNSMSALENASDYVGLANVTAVSTVVVLGLPVLVYNITVIQNLVQDPIVGAGSNLTVAQIGGTANGTTWQVGGFPTLVVGHEYVFFLTQYETLFAEYYELYPAVVGGPQGLFYVQDGNVYSLDNMYPQTDSWLPVRAAGVPLAQFIQEIHTASTSSTSTLIG